MSNYFDPATLPPLPTARIEKAIALAGGTMPFAFEINLGGDITEAINTKAAEIYQGYGPGGTKEDTASSPGAPPVRFTPFMAANIARLMVACVLPENAPEGYKLWDERQWAMLLQRDREGFLEVLKALNEAEESLGASDSKNE